MKDNILHPAVRAPLTTTDRHLTVPSSGFLVHRRLRENIRADCFPRMKRAVQRITL
jgi:hypothetical protein